MGKQVAFFALFVVILFSGYTQQPAGDGYVLKGTVAGQDHIGLANVTLVIRYQADSGIVITTMSDTAGAFSATVAKPGNYSVTCKLLLYRSVSREVTIAARLTNLGVLTLYPAPSNLQQVTVTSTHKKFIERKLDRFVVNVEGHPAFAAGAAFDVIQAAPGVYVTEGRQLHIMGKSNTQVMIDGKLLRLSADELESLLKNMPADLIAAVEVITTPSSRFDANGNAGYINIVTKRSKEKGWNASTSVSGAKGRFGRVAANGSFNYKSRTVDLTSSYTIGQSHSYENILLYNNILRSSDQAVTRIHSNNYERRKEFYQSFNSQLDIRLNRLSNTGVTVRLFSDDSPRPANNSTSSINDQSGIDSAFRTNNQHYLNLLNYSVDVYYNYKLDTLGKTMLIDLSYARYKDEENQRFANTFFANGVPYGEEEWIRSFFNNITRIQTAAIDFTFPLGKNKLETGAKLAHTQAENTFLFQQFHQQKWVSDTGISNRFNYTETNAATYLSWSREVSGKLSFQLGLRGEYTRTRGYSITLEKETLYNYFQLFPTAYLQYIQSKHYQFNVSYSRRIGRPSFDYLNPFVTYQSPLFTNEGNPLLRPSFTHSVEINHTFNSKYIVTLFSNYTTRFFSEFPYRVAGSDETRYTYDNIGTNFNYGIQLIAPQNITSWWSVNHTILGMYQQFEVGYNGISQQLKKLFWLYLLSSNLKLSKHINAEVSAQYTSSTLQGFYRVGNNANVSLGITGALWNNTAIIGLSVADLLYTNRSKVSIVYPLQTLGFTRYNDTRLVKISFKYKFGNNLLKNKDKVKSGSQEEQNRAN